MSPDQQRSWKDRASVVIDQAAGVKLHFNHKNHTAVIEFLDGKPSDAIRATMKDNGFSWRIPDKDSLTWQKKIRLATREQDRATALATFNEVADMLRAEKGVAHSR